MKWEALTTDEKETVKMMLKCASSSGNTERLLRIVNAVLVFMGEADVKAAQGETHHGATPAKERK